MTCHQTLRDRPLYWCPTEINGSANLFKQRLHGLDLALLVLRDSADYDVFGAREILRVLKPSVIAHFTGAPPRSMAARTCSSNVSTASISPCLSFVTALTTMSSARARSSGSSNPSDSDRSPRRPSAIASGIWPTPRFIAAPDSASRRRNSVASAAGKDEAARLP